MSEMTENEPIAVAMTALITLGNGAETSETLGVVCGDTQEEFDECLERRLARVRRDYPGCKVVATEA